MIYLFIFPYVLFSSFKLKAERSFLDRLLSVVRPSFCPIEPNLTQSIIGQKFKFVLMKGHALFQKEIITKYRKHILRKFKYTLQNLLANFNQTILVEGD